MLILLMNLLLLLLLSIHLNVTLFTLSSLVLAFAVISSKVYYLILYYLCIINMKFVLYKIHNTTIKKWTDYGISICHHYNVA